MEHRHRREVVGRRQQWPSQRFTGRVARSVRRDAFLAHSAARYSYVAVSEVWSEDCPFSERDDALAQAGGTDTAADGRSVGNFRRPCRLLGERTAHARPVTDRPILEVRFAIEVVHYR